MEPYRLGLYEKALPASLSWKEKLEAAKKSGFDYVEISIDETEEKLRRLDSTHAERSELLRLMEETGVPIRSMCLSAHRKYPMGSLDQSIRQRSMDIMEKAVSYAAELGIRVIQLAGYDEYYNPGSEKTEEFFTRNLEKAVSMAAAAGVMLGFETMETPFMDTVGKAMRYVGRVGNPYLGVYPDIGNLQNAALLYRKPAPEDIVAGSGHIVAVHLKETAPGRYREVPFSTGHTDYTGCLAQLKSQNVRRYVGEFWYLGSPEWEKDLKFASRFLRGKLDSVWKYQ